MKKHFLALFIGAICGTLAFSILQMISTTTNKKNQLSTTDTFIHIYWPVFATVFGFSISEFISTKMED